MKAYFCCISVFKKMNAEKRKKKNFRKKNIFNNNISKSQKNNLKAMISF